VGYYLRFSIYWFSTSFRPKGRGIEPIAASITRMMIKGATGTVIDAT
jgi:hypothetical protein